MRLSVKVYPPGNHTMVQTGKRSDILKAPAELHPGPLLVKSGSDRLQPGSRTGGGVGVPCVLSFKKIVPVSLADPDRGPAEPLPDCLQA